MNKTWDSFDVFEEAIGKYMLPYGEGETMASQIATAVNKLVFKWFNDGDVFDNTHSLKGWCNDLSSYANWLYVHTGADNILLRISEVESEDDYTELLYALCEYCLNEELLKAYEAHPKTGSIYDCNGPFRFEEVTEEEDEEYWI